MSDRKIVSGNGAVRVRSNICTDPNATHLVPWNLAKSCWPELTPTHLQKEEASYYMRCDLCKRRLFEIHEFGCDHHICRRQGLPSVAEAALRRERRQTSDDDSHR